VIVADSDVLIDYLRGRDPMADRVELELKSRGFATTTVNAFELWAGASSPRQLSAVEALLGAMTILPLEEEAARRAADLQRQLVASGQGIGMADCLIAGICLIHGALLLTGNRRHFERVPGLRLSVR
jgi:tRNA(fMet)-specific endonuclease VapC